MMPERRSPAARTCLPRPADRRAIAVGSVGLLSQGVYLAGWLAAGTWQPPGYSPVKDTITLDATGGGIVAVMVCVAPFPMARRMRDVAGWQRLVRPSLLAGAAMFACIVTMDLGVAGLGAAASVLGLVERVGATIGNIWAAVLAVNLIRVSRGATAGQRVAVRQPRSSESAGHPD
jgi:hypothetical protein